MPIDKRNDERDLLADIKVLEQENSMLQERAEEITLLLSVGDILFSSEDVDAIMQDVLERVSIFLDIPLCIFGVVENQNLRVKNVYAVFSEESPDKNCIKLSDEILAFHDKTPSVYRYDKHSADGVEFKLGETDFTPGTVGVFPASTEDDKNIVFVFVDDSDKSDGMEMHRRILRALIYKITSRLDNLSLSRRLEGLNAELEDRVARRTIEFQESEERFRMVMHQSPQVVELYDSNGLQIDVNEAYEKMWGFEASTTVNKFNLFTSEEVKNTGLINYINQAYAGETVTLPEYTFDPSGATEADGKGRTRWLSTKIYPLKDLDGEVTSIVITHEDITATRAAKDMLVESEARYRGLFESSIDGICTLDAESNYIDVNPAAQKLLGYSREQLLQMSVKDVVVAEDEDKSAYFLNKLKTDGFYQGYEGRVMRSSGEIRYVEVSSIAIYEGDNIVGSHDILRDVTDRVVAEKKIAANLSEKEVLLQEIQHRTKNNMMVIIALLNMQARESGSSRLDKAFQVTQDRIYAMSLVYDQLHKSDDFAAIDLRHYITILSNKLHTSLVPDPSRIKFEVISESIPISLTQAVPVGIVLNEVVTNSLQHAFPDQRQGLIKVMAKLLDARTLELTIQDDGIGVPEELVDKSQESLGLRLVKMLVNDQLAGEHIIVIEQGMKHTIKFSLSEV